MIALFLSVWLVNVISITIDFTNGPVDLPYAFSSGCMAQIDDGTIFNFGGAYFNEARLEKQDSSDIMKYNPSSDTSFEILSNITTPTPIYCLQNTVYSKTTKLIYIIGSYPTVNVNYLFDPSSLQFVDTTNTALSAKTFTSIPCVSIIENADMKAIYVYGGTYEVNQTTSPLNILDLDKNEWMNDIQDGPVKGAGFSCVAATNYFFVFGGETINDDMFTNHDDILRYDINENQWNVMSNSLVPTDGAKAVLYPIHEVDDNDIILIIAGNTPLEFLSTVQIYHYNTNQLENYTLSLVDNSGYVMTAFIDDKLTIFGGNIGGNEFSSSSSVASVARLVTTTTTTSAAPTSPTTSTTQAPTATTSKSPTASTTEAVTAPTTSTTLTAEEPSEPANKSPAPSISAESTSTNVPTQNTVIIHETISSTTTTDKPTTIHETTSTMTAKPTESVPEATTSTTENETSKESTSTELPEEGESAPASEKSFVESTEGMIVLIVGGVAVVCCAIVCFYKFCKKKDDQEVVVYGAVSEVTDNEEIEI